jgi:DNA-binding MarR family transcriptional regulator
MNLGRPDELEPHLARVAAAWQGIVGEVDTGALGIFGRLEALARELAALQRDVLTKFDLNYAEFTTIGMLRTSFPNFQGSPTELRRLVGQSSAGMTRILAKLESEGLVRRDAHAEDGRRVHVALTARGVALAKRSFLAMMAEQARLLAPCGKRQRAEIGGALDGLLEAFASRAK